MTFQIVSAKNDVFQIAYELNANFQKYFCCYGNGTIFCLRTFSEINSGWTKINGE